MHPEGRDGKDCRVLSQAAREFAHGIGYPIDLFGGHASGKIKRKDNRRRPRSAFQPFDIERINRPFDSVFEEFEILPAQISYRSPGGVRYGDINGNEIGVNLDDFLRFGFHRQHATWTLGL